MTDARKPVSFADQAVRRAWEADAYKAGLPRRTAFWRWLARRRGQDARRVVLSYTDEELSVRREGS